MKDMLENMEDILNHTVSGFHQYALTEPVRLRFASQNLCDMLGADKEELLGGDEDGYLLTVHPGDRARYAEFIGSFRTEGQADTLQYRMVRKDGAVLEVSDTVTVRKLNDGALVGDSVLTDITELKNEHDNLKFLNETIPCGFLRYTCEKQPKITYINQQMLDFLRFPAVKAGELDYLELCRENIFLMVPMEERRRFTLYLNRVYTSGTPLVGEMTLLRCDGTRAYFVGWVTKCLNEQGVEEFQSVCMDVTARQQAKTAREARRYLKALSEVYDKIFEYDLSNNTVKCLHSHGSPMFKWVENVPMRMEEATENWIAGTVVDEDRETVREFFHAFQNKRLYQKDGRPPQITYRAKSSSGEVKIYNGIFLKMDDSVSLYCFRNVPTDDEAEFLRSENVSLKENMQELVKRFTNGMAAFEVRDEMITPLYAGDNVLEFFGLSKEEWLPLMKKSTPLKELTARSEVAYEDFVELLQTGEAEFTYFDCKTETERRIKAICSQKLPSSTSLRYVLLYKVEEAEPPEGSVLPGGCAVSIRTFGYFDVFVGGRPIAFRNKKSKELFALLVDRRGGYISSEEAIGFLWEDEPVSPVTLARYRKVALRLKNILEEYGISDVVETVDGNRRIVPERVQCDLYDYLSGKQEFAQLFKGSYLTNYSWGESTLAELSGDMLF